MIKLPSTVSYKTAVGVVVVGSLAAEALFYTLRWWFRNKSRRQILREQRRNVFHRIIFFPDQKVACRVHFTDRYGCRNKDCRYSHEETALSEMLGYIDRATESLDVCVFTITSHELTNAVIARHKRGLAVRVVTDNEQLESQGSQIGKLRAEGIPVRNNRSSFFMHHKFVLVDSRVLINGSFNWTRQAITGNNENVIITNNQEIVTPYVKEFEKLWDEFDPKQYLN